jgi:hypothetical protein
MSEETDLSLDKIASSAEPDHEPDESAFPAVAYV